MSKPDAGYTLMEVVVALLLLSLIGLLVTGGMRFGTQAWRRSDQEISAADGALSTQKILRNALVSAVPNLSAGFASFYGRRDRVSFDSPAPPAFASGGIAHFELTLVSYGAGTRLSLTVRSPSNKREAILADSAAPLELSYLDASARIPAWLAVWRNRDRLPDAVRIAGATPVKNADWPPLIVRLAIAQDPNCEFDPVSASCRRL
jgi:general secretion pathway protein J